MKIQTSKSIQFYPDWVNQSGFFFSKDVLLLFKLKLFTGYRSSIRKANPAGPRLYQCFNHPSREYSSYAVFPAIVVFPTPPFWFVTAMISAIFLSSLQRQIQIWRIICHEGFNRMPAVRLKKLCQTEITAQFASDSVIHIIKHFVLFHIKYAKKNLNN